MKPFHIEQGQPQVLEDEMKEEESMWSNELGGGGEDSNNDDNNNNNEEHDESVSLLTIKGHPNDETFNPEAANRRLFLQMLLPLLMPLSLLFLALLIGYNAAFHPFASDNNPQDENNNNSNKSPTQHLNQHHSVLHNADDLDTYPDPWPYTVYPKPNTTIRLHRPPLESLIRPTPNHHGHAIVVETQPPQDQQQDQEPPLDWIVDFAIIGFPKCGTSNLMKWLSTSSHVFLDDREYYAMSLGQPGNLVQHFYNVMDELQEQQTLSFKPPPPLDQIRLGMKNPGDIDSYTSLGGFARYFPTTKFIVQLRHPILWFQSFYNFRLRNKVQRHKGVSAATAMPQPETLIGSCTREDTESSYSCARSWNLAECKPGSNVCTNRGRFHHAISRLGLTPLNTTDEWDLLNHHNMTIHPTTQPVFFLELSQTFDDNDQQSQEQLRRDLQAFLDIPYLPPRKPYHVPYTRIEGEIDICEDQYRHVRQILLGHGQEASQWILRYLLYSPQAIVSSRDRFVKAVQQWATDPCESQ